MTPLSGCFTCTGNEISNDEFIVADLSDLCAPCGPSTNPDEAVDGDEFTASGSFSAGRTKRAVRQVDRGHVSFSMPTAKHGTPEKVAAAEETKEEGGAKQKLFFMFGPQHDVGIGIRVAPRLDAPRTGGGIFPGDIVEGTAVVNVPNPGAGGGAPPPLLPEVPFLRLADGSGWVFIKNPESGAELLSAITSEEAAIIIAAVEAAHTTDMAADDDADEYADAGAAARGDDEGGFSDVEDAGDRHLTHPTRSGEAAFAELGVDR